MPNKKHPICRKTLPIWSSDLRSDASMPELRNYSLCGAGLTFRCYVEDCASLPANIATFVPKYKFGTEFNSNDVQMDIKEFSKLLRTKQKEIETLLRRKMPIRVGNMAKRHYQDNFRKGGFVDGGLHAWPKTKRQTAGGTSAVSHHNPLLSNRNHLFNSVRYVPGDYRVKIVNDVPYAPIHNWGGESTPAVTPKMRGFAWAMYYKAGGKPKAGTKGRKSTEKSQTAALSPEARMWRGLALTKKKRLRIRIPQRQFIGPSRELEEQIRTDVEMQIGSLLKK